MNTTAADPRRVEILTQAMAKLREAGEVLREFSDDPRVELVLPHLEGMGEGWFHPNALGADKPQDFLVDLLIDLLCEAQGTPVEDHWRGHAMTVEEAEVELQSIANIIELR